MTLSQKHRKWINQIIQDVRRADTDGWPANEKWRSRTVQSLQNALAAPEDLYETAYRQIAKDARHCEGDLEIDDDAPVSRTEVGAYVQAWVWVDASEIAPLKLEAV